MTATLQALVAELQLTIAEQRAMAPPERVDVVTELPVIHPRITEDRLHRLACPSCEIRTRASLPAGVPT